MKGGPADVKKFFQSGSKRVTSILSTYLSIVSSIIVGMDSGSMYFGEGLKEIRLQRAKKEHLKHKVTMDDNDHPYISFLLLGLYCLSNVKLSRET